MNKPNSHILALFILLYSFIPGVVVSGNLYKTVSPATCDSLIRANSTNPDFVILDVRTPAVWMADHLAGSINRNFYDADFTQQLNKLPRHKLYLLHCQSGSRSASTFSTMKSLNFATVFEMSGGISAWKSNGFPTTSQLTANLMVVSQKYSSGTNFRLGIPDTLRIILTNRGNDTLRFTSLQVTEPTEFRTDFNPGKPLAGAEDYQFQLIYSPSGKVIEKAGLRINSNGGNLTLDVAVQKSTHIPSLSSDDLFLFPNPADGYFRIGGTFGNVAGRVSIFSSDGMLVRNAGNALLTRPVFIGDLPAGWYVVAIDLGGRKIWRKLIIGR